MSPNHIKAKARKYYNMLEPMFIASHMSAGAGVDVHIKHKTIRDLLNLFGEIAGLSDPGGEVE